jgi:hopanoid biosynthesis associated RND transporter like protein HpnN
VAIKVLTSWRRARFRDVAGPLRWPFGALPLTSAVSAVVDFCIGRPLWILGWAIALAAASGIYAAGHFAIKTDIHELISHDLPWAKRAIEYMKAFPQFGIIIVIDAPTPELAEQASTELTRALLTHPERFLAVSHPGSGKFFEQNGLLFLPTDEVARFANVLRQADPLIGTLAEDPSLRGILAAMSMVFIGVKRGIIELDDMARPLTMAANTLEAVAVNRPASFSWQALARGGPATPEDRRRFLQVEPVLDFTELQPGRRATELISRLAADLKLGDQQVTIRQTGQIAIEDEQFGTLKQSAILNIAVSVLGVLVILWLALHSLRIIAAVVVSLTIGLAVSTAVGLILVGALNVISVAFFVLFIGLGVDFGLQFSVRYRAERHDHPDLRTALLSAARKAGTPLALASVATAVGFCSFLPTDYRGLAELGAIAGVGMLIAFATSVTVLPALLAIMKPPGEPHPVGFTALAPVDRFLEQHRVPVVVGTILVVGFASPLLLYLRFDFDPMHLRNSTVESVATYYELRKDPSTGANAIDIVANDLDGANATAHRISGLQQVAQVRTLSAFIPDNQNAKLKLIHDAAAALDGALNPSEMISPPTDQDHVEALLAAADTLTKAAGDQHGPGPDAARRLSGLLSKLAQGSAVDRQRVERAFAEPLRFTLELLRMSLRPERISPETIPPEIARDWVAPDGRARVEILPKGDPDDTQTVRNFVRAVLATEPDASGPAVELFEAGNMVVHSFIEAGVFALGVIAILLLIALRRVGDVLLTLVPLVIAGVVTLELCAALGIPLNFANIMALPLLLGVGVAFKIYYILAWRAGRTSLLQSSLTRAVVFSAMTTATAFGSLWLSSDPGTSSMGKLMALALTCTMAAAVLFQPALMGPPRGSKLLPPYPSPDAGKGREACR